MVRLEIVRFLELREVLSAKPLVGDLRDAWIPAATKSKVEPRR